MLYLYIIFLIPNHQHHRALFDRYHQHRKQDNILSGVDESIGINTIITSDSDNNAAGIPVFIDEEPLLLDVELNSYDPTLFGGVYGPQY